MELPNAGHDRFCPGGGLRPWPPLAQYAHPRSCRPSLRGAVIMLLLAVILSVASTRAGPGGRSGCGVAHVTGGGEVQLRLARWVGGPGGVGATIGFLWCGHF